MSPEDLAAFRISVIRTVVPFAAAWAGPSLARWLGMTDTEVSGFFTIIIGAVVYVGIRLLERVDPRFGVLIGAIGTPRYADRGVKPRHVAPVDSGVTWVGGVVAFAAAILLIAATFLLGDGTARAVGVTPSPTPTPASDAPLEHPGIHWAGPRCSGPIRVAIRVERVDGLRWVSVSGPVPVVVDGTDSPALDSWTSVGSGSVDGTGGWVTLDPGQRPKVVRVSLADGTTSTPVIVAGRPASCPALDDPAPTPRGRSAWKVDAR